MQLVQKRESQVGQLEIIKFQVLLQRRPHCTHAQRRLGTSCSKMYGGWAVSSWQVKDSAVHASSKMQNHQLPFPADGYIMHPAMLRDRVQVLAHKQEWAALKPSRLNVSGHSLLHVPLYPPCAVQSHACSGNFHRCGP